MDDWRFRIQIVVDPWDEAVLIFLGENLDHHLGLDSTEAQEDFIRHSGFNSVPAVDPQLLPRAPLGSDQGQRPRARQPLQQHLLVVNDTNFPPLLSASPINLSGPSYEVASSAPLLSLSCGGSLAPGGMRDSGLLLVPPASELASPSYGGAGTSRDRFPVSPEMPSQLLIKVPSLDLAGSTKLLAHRISPRLAIKKRGVKKSSILKA